MLLPFGTDDTARVLFVAQEEVDEAGLARVHLPYHQHYWLVSEEGLVQLWFHQLKVLQLFFYFVRSSVVQTKRTTPI